MRTSKYVIADPLMKRRLSFSPDRNRPFQLPSEVVSFMRKVYVLPLTSDRSVGVIRIWPHILRSSTVAARPCCFTSSKKSPTVCLEKLSKSDRFLSRANRRFGSRSVRSEEHTSELQSLMRKSYAVFCLKKKIITRTEEQDIST